MIGGDWGVPLGALLGLNSALGRNAVFAAVTVLSIAASVALSTSLEMSSRAVQQLADRTAEALAGAAQLEIVAGALGIPERLVAEVRAAPGVAAASPLLTANLQIDAAKLSIHVLGIDLLEEGVGRGLDLRARGAQVPDALKLLARADAVVISELVSTRTGAGFDESLEVRTPIGAHTLHVEGLLADRGVARAFGGQIAVMDLYALQALVGRADSVDRIDVVPAPGADLAALRAELERRVAGAATVRRPGMRKSSLDQTMGALRAAVWMIAAIGSLVACLLSYAAMSTAVERRLHEFAVLRSTGFSAREVARFVAFDSLAFAALGTALGLAAGRALAQLFLPTLSQVSEYFEAGSTRASDVSVSGATVALALGVGVLGALCGALGPARLATRRYVLDAAREPNAEAGPRGGTHMRVPWPSLLALALAAAAWAPGMPPRVRLLALLALGTSLAASLVTPALAGIDGARELLGRLVPGVGHLAGTGLAVRKRGTALAVAAITCLVAFVSGGIVLSASFGETLLNALRTRYPEGIDITTTAAFDDGAAPPLLASVVDTIRHIPGVADLSEQVQTTMLVRGEEVLLAAFESRVSLARRSGYRDRAERAVLAALGRGEVGVSGAFARHFELSAGDEVELATPQGRQRFKIAGELFGMAGPSGILYMDLATFDAHWSRAGADFALLFVAGDPAPVIDAIRKATYSQQSLFFTSNEELLARAATFAARFDGLLFGVAMLALLLGGVAIANLLLGIVAARRREFVLLRTAGAAPNQLAALVLGDAAGIAGFSLLGGACLGFLLSRPMLEIMGEEFGLYVDAHLDLPRLALLFALVAASVFASALYPALLARRATTLEVSSFG
ncbi:MAG TPA: FtsX-like permease family protein [Myxococcota bacterium]|nr:FtsX-like permease family protein [Myxococcota bacterium]